MLKKTISLLCYLSVTCYIQVNAEALKIPTNSLFTYKPTTTLETIENFSFERLKLDGQRPIIGEPLDGFMYKPKASSPGIRFESRTNPLISARIVAFPADQFSLQITPEILNSYLEQKSLEYPQNSEFKIIEKAEVNTGPAKFRFLSGKTYVLTYEYNIYDSEGNPVRMSSSECWRLNNGSYYVWITEAPIQFFSKVFQYMKTKAVRFDFADV